MEKIIFCPNCGNKVKLEEHEEHGVVWYEGECSECGFELVVYDYGGVEGWIEISFC
jgi:transcription initiation factor IIE alpha subunit